MEDRIQHGAKEGPDTAPERPVESRKHLPDENSFQPDNDELFLKKAAGIRDEMQAGG